MFVKHPNWKAGSFLWQTDHILSLACMNSNFQMSRSHYLPMSCVMLHVDLVFASSACTSKHFLSWQNFIFVALHYCHKLKPDLTRNGQQLLSVVQMSSKWQKLKTVTQYALQPTSKTQLSIILVRLHITSCLSCPQARLGSVYVSSGSISPHTC